MQDWPGEIEFYQGLAAEAVANGEALLEVACGTGRVAIRLAQSGAGVVAMDLSSAMLEVAREKSAGMPNLRWVQSDMRSFELGETFGLVIVPGHAFQNMLTPGDQIACLESIRRHMAPRGMLVLHLDHPNYENLKWLGELHPERGQVFEDAEEFTHPKTGRQVRASRAWTYAPSTQTASVVTRWEEIGPEGKIIDRWETGTVRLHSAFPFEMEHLLVRAGFAVEAVYGDFFRGELRGDSTDMVWIARTREISG